MAFIVGDPQFRQRTAGRSERLIQAEIRPLIIQYLETHFAGAGYKDTTRKANDSLYWEGQERGEACPGVRSYRLPDLLRRKLGRLASSVLEDALGSPREAGTPGSRSAHRVRYHS